MQPYSSFCKEEAPPPRTRLPYVEVASQTARRALGLGFRVRGLRFLISVGGGFQGNYWGLGLSVKCPRFKVGGLGSGIVGIGFR